MKLTNIKKIPKHRLLECLPGEIISFDEAMRAHNIYPHEVPLEGQVAAFVYYSERGRYHIFVSTFLSPQARREVFLHEIHHITEDMPRKGYILGLDMYREPLEQRADQFVKEFTATYTAKKN